MARRVLSWALVLVVAWTARPATAQTASPLKAIPSEAAVVVRVKGFQGTLNKLASLADAVQQGAGQTVKMGGGFAGTLLKNPVMEGVDQAGDFYVAVFVSKEEAPGLVFIVPGKDLDAMEEALGENVTFVKSGKHGIYSEDEDLANAFKEQLASKEKDSLGDEMDEKSLAALNRGDISVFVNVPALLEVYKDEFQQVHGLLEQLQEQKPEGDTPGVNTEAVMERMQVIAKGLIQAVEDHEGITIALSVTDKDLVIEEFFKVGEDTETGKILKAGNVSDMPLLNSLPADAIGYYGVQFNISELMAWGIDFAEDVITDEKASEAIKAVATDLKGVKFTGLAGAINLADTPDEGLLRLVNLIATDSPGKVRALTKKYAETVKEVDSNGVKTEVTYKADAEKIGKTSVDVMSAKITVSDDAPGADQQKAVLKAVYGEDGATTRSAYLKDKIVQTTGGGKAAIEAALKAVETPTKSASLQAVKAKLGAKPCFVALIDFATLAVKGMGLAKSFGGDDLPFDVEAIAKDLELKPSYLGFGIEVHDAALSLKTVVPVDQIKSLVKIGMKVQAVQNGETGEEEKKDDDK